MTSREVIAECKRRYKDGDRVQCVYQGIPGKEYVINMKNLRDVGHWIVCDDANNNTPFVALYNESKKLFAPIVMASTDPRVTEIYIPKKQPHVIELISNVVAIATEINKYEKLGNIIGSLQKYQREETLLDQQLRNFKMKQDA